VACGPTTNAVLADEHLRRGPVARGWANGRAKPTEGELEEIREWCAVGFTIKKLAEHYGVDEKTAPLLLRWRGVETSSGNIGSQSDHKRCVMIESLMILWS
jgi:hypothetical protein